MNLFGAVDYLLFAGNYGIVVGTILIAVVKPPRWKRLLIGCVLASLLGFVRILIADEVGAISNIVFFSSAVGLAVSAGLSAVLEWHRRR